MTVQRDALTNYLHGFLNVNQFKDYCPNGLQVEGKPQIKKIVYGVTASLKLIEAAVEAQADALIVHHGLFWSGQDSRVVGWMKQRLQRLLKHDINLYAYHLPLDGHSDVGNNAMLARALGADAVLEYMGEQNIIASSYFEAPMTLDTLGQRVCKLLNREPLIIPGDGRMVHKVGICSGGAQSYFEAAIAAGADAFITGEISEPQTHLARETGIAYIAAGHHATERLGIQALGKHINDKFALDGQYIEIANPV
ncbi:MAG: Nif3-like dinuclear metal center hexameric protein [Saezia sp.]